MLNYTTKVIGEIRNNYKEYTNETGRQFANNIIEKIIHPRLRGELPRGVQYESGVDGTILTVPSRAEELYRSGYMNYKGKEYELACAWALAYVSSGPIGEHINKGRYLHRIYTALQSYQVDYNTKLTAVDKAVIFHNVNVLFGLESYLYIYNSKPFVLVETEDWDELSNKERTFSIIDINTAVLATLPQTDKDKRDAKEPVTLSMPAEIPLSIDRAQAFLDGKLGELCNYKSNERNLAELSALYNIGANEDDRDIIGLRFVPSFERFCISTESPTPTNTYNRN